MYVNTQTAMTGNARAGALQSEPEIGASPEKARAGESPPSGRLKECSIRPLPGSARYSGGAYFCALWSGRILCAKMGGTAKPRPMCGRGFFVFP